MGRDLEVVHEGIDFGEGPRWRPDDEGGGRLWLSDFYNHHVLSLGPDGDARVEVILDDEPSGLGHALATRCPLNRP